MKRNHINTRDVFTFSKDFSLFLLLNFAPFLEDVCVLLDSLIDVCGNQFARYFLKAPFFKQQNRYIFVFLFQTSLNRCFSILSFFASLSSAQ